MSESERLCSKLLNRLKDIGSAAIALSGGVDSCFLAYAASRVEGGNFAAYYVQSAFQPEFELTDALRAAKEAGLPLKLFLLISLPAKMLSAIRPTAATIAKNTFFPRYAKRRRRTGTKRFWTGRMLPIQRMTVRECVPCGKRACFPRCANAD